MTLDPVCRRGRPRAPRVPLRSLQKGRRTLCVPRLAVGWRVALVLLGMGGAGSAAADPSAIATTGDAFIVRQLDKFTIPADYPLGFAGAQLIQSYDLPPPTFTGGDDPLAHRADVYDSSLALIALVEAGALDRAGQLADGLRLVQALDPFGDGRLRASYFANDLLDPGNAVPSIDDGAAAAGNLAWAGIALARFYAAAIAAAYLTPEAATVYLEAARAIGQWIDAQLRQDDAYGGYSLGRDAADALLFGTPHGRSTEHNLDVYVLARHLAFLDPIDPGWPAMAAHAQGFVRAMRDPTTGRYRTGTEDDGSGAIVPAESPTPADAQTWSALGGVDASVHRAQALRFTADTAPADPLHLVVTDDLGDGRVYRGLRFSSGGAHVHGEETAGYAMALLVGVSQGWLTPQAGEAADRWSGEAGDVLAELDAMRTGAPGADPVGLGLVATPWPDGAYTGWEGPGEPPGYRNLRHVASTAWLTLAARVAAGDAEANPLRAVPEPGAALQLASGLATLAGLHAASGRRHRRTERGHG